MNRCLHGIIVFIAVSVSASGAENSFGVLPPGTLSTNELSEISAEICRDHIFDPSSVSGRLPRGYRLLSVEECAKGDPAVAEFLKVNPKYGRHAVGSFCFMSVGKFTVDGVRIHPAGATPMAFWWARAEGPRDSRMRGKSQWLQLASWYSRDITERTAVLATDPMAQFTDIQVAQVASRLWRLRLVLADEVVQGEVRCSGEVTQRRQSGEQFMTVPFSGAGTGYFWVISYFGHHHQQSHGEWQSRGTGVFSAALQIPNEEKTFTTVFQNGWSALSGLYRVNPPH